MMTVLKTFVLVGVVDSTDQFFASVEINTNPPVAEASLAVIPLHAFPCDIKEGDHFYILKLTEDDDSVIICKDKVDDKPRCFR
jgi:hypothetical protein